MTAQAGQRCVFISYHWNDQPVACRIRDDLRKRGYETWLDIDRVKPGSGFLLEHDQVTDALRNAFAVVILVSPAYNNSMSCRQELESAKELEALHPGQISLPFIPIMLDKTFQISSWLQYLVKGTSQYDPQDLSGLAKKLWAVSDVGKNLQPMDSASQLSFDELIDWVLVQSTITNESSCEKLKLLSEGLLDEKNRKQHAKELVPVLFKLISSTPGKNPHTTKAILQCLIQFGLDNSQSGLLRPYLDEDFLASLDKIALISGASEAWDACATVAKDFQYLCSSNLLGSGRKKVLISYSWDGKVIGVRLYEHLRQHASGWDIVDVENVAGGVSNIERNAALVASCTVVLAVVTPGFGRSYLCKADLTTAKNWSKKTIFIAGDADYKKTSSAWLKFAMGNDPQYVLPSTKEDFESVLNTMIHTDLRPIERGEVVSSSSNHHTVPSAPSSAAPRRVVAISTAEEVQDWLRSIGIEEAGALFERFVLENIDGDCLRGLAAVSALDLKTLFEKARLFDILKLKAGLDDLFLV